MIMALAGALQAAGGNLNIDKFFSSRYSSNPKVTVIDVSNHSHTEKIRTYRSISVAGDPALADKIAEAVAKDGSHAASKEVSYKDGILYYGFFSMGGTGENRRYILYLNRRPTGKEKTTLVYIEADMDEAAVKKMINN